jgi:DNA primase
MTLTQRRSRLPCATCVLTLTRCARSLDNDETGRAATARAVEQAARAERSPGLFVVDPELLGSEKDPDAYVHTRGVAAWRALLEERQCAIAWRAGEHLRGVNADSAQEKRREALSRVGAWLGTLPPRLALEQEDAIKAAAVRCRYSPDSVQRAFRARFWTEPRRVRSPAQERDSASESPEREPMDAGPDL